MKYYKIGETFRLNNLCFKVVKAEKWWSRCNACFFDKYNEENGDCGLIAPECGRKHRPDDQNVYFVEVQE